MNKKGIFFTAMVIVILTLFFIGYTFYSDSQDRFSVEKRINTLNDFIFSIEEDIPRQLYISGYRTVFLIEKEIIEKGKYASQVENVFQESFFNGSINGTPQVIMEGATFDDITQSIRDKASKLNLDFDMQNSSIEIYQSDPWNIEIELTTNIQVSDRNGLVEWTGERVFFGKIPISGFDDPFYAIGTNGVVNNKIRTSLFTNFVNGNNVSNLLNHTLEGYYVSSELAPSFLQRLEGDFTASPYGIESLTNLQKLSSQGINVKDKSVVDYIYFGSTNPSSQRIQGMPTWFKLDSSHLSKYQVSNLTI